MEQRKKLYSHLVLWLLNILLILGFGASFIEIGYVFKVLVSGVCLLIPLFYLNYAYLFNHYYKKKRITVYFLISFCLVLVVTYFRFLFEMFFIEEQTILNTERHEFLIFFRYFLSSVGFFGLSFAFKIIEDWGKQEKELYRLRALKNEADLKNLKNQLRPHFLFNSINNIYAIAIENNDGSAPLLLELSEMLRYLMHKTERSLIPLTEEVSFINSLIELYSLRYDFVPFKELLIEGNINSIEIPPLIFLPFVENIYKHGDFDCLDQSWLLHLKTNESQLVFESSNPIRKEDNSKEEKSELGLFNLKKRLELLFPEAYSLTERIEGDIYHVMLKVNLNEK